MLIASFFWIRGSLIISVKDMAALAGTRWGYNSAVLKNLSSQKADSLVAALLLLLSFALQGINLAWPMRFTDFDISIKGLLFGVVISCVLFLGCYFGASLLAKNYCSKAQALLQ